MTEQTPWQRAGLRDEIARAIHRYDHDHMLSGNDIPSDHHRGEADAILPVLYREWPWLRVEAEDAPSAGPAPATDPATVERVARHLDGWEMQSSRTRADYPTLAREVIGIVRAGQPTGTDRAAAPAVWIDGHPQLEAIAAAVWEKCGRSDSGTCVEDDPRNIAVAALAAVLPASTDRADDDLPSAEGLPPGALDSATDGANALDAWARDPHGRNFLAHALVQLARDGWLRREPDLDAAFDTSDRPRETPEPQEAP